MLAALVLALVPGLPQEAVVAKPARPRVGRGLGEVHPDLELPRIDATPGAGDDGAGTLRLSALRGRKVLLIEFASW